MALPKGIRKIIIDGTQYYFTVKAEYYGMTLQTAIGLVENTGKRFYMSVLQGDEHLPKPAGDTMGVITPALVARAIKFVTTNTDWPYTKQSIHVRLTDNQLEMR